MSNHEYIYICTNCNHETYSPETNCPKCTGFMKCKKLFKAGLLLKAGFACLALLVLANINSALKDLHFHFTHINPIASYEEETLVDPYRQQPVLVRYKESVPNISYPTNKGTYTLIPRAKYSLAAMVMAKNTNFWLRDVMRSEFDNMSLIDLGLAWQKAIDPEVLEYTSYNSHKTLAEGRKLFVWVNAGSPISFSYIFRHSSHNHLIPANDNIMSALYILKLGDYVELKGYLVDSIFPSGRKDWTSVSLSDTNPKTKAGACERMYVTSVKIGNKVYE